MITPNRITEANNSLTKIKGYEAPTEIREDEAELTHLILIRSTPNTKTMEFTHKAKIVKLNREALAVSKDQITKGAETVVILHDGEKYKSEAKANKAAEAAETAKINKEAEEAAAKAAKEAEDKAKEDANTIEELRKALAASEAKNAKKAAKEVVKESTEEAAAKAEEGAKAEEK